MLVDVTDLRSGGGVLMWRCWIWRRRCVVDAVCDWLSTIRDSLTAFKSVEICWIFFESLLVPKCVEISRSLCIRLAYYTSVLAVFRANCELRLICLGFHTLLLHQFLACIAASWISMGRSLLIRDRKLESNGIFVGQVNVFFGGLEAEGSPSKNGIRLL
jgi:hypothetical protein